MPTGARNASRRAECQPACGIPTGARNASRRAEYQPAREIPTSARNAARQVAMIEVKVGPGRVVAFNKTSYRYTVEFQTDLGTPRPYPALTKLQRKRMVAQSVNTTCAHRSALRATENRREPHRTTEKIAENRRQTQRTIETRVR